jgi:hypothetical protein
VKGKKPASVPVTDKTTEEEDEEHFEDTKTSNS